MRVLSLLLLFPFFSIGQFQIEGPDSSCSSISSYYYGFDELTLSASTPTDGKFYDQNWENELIYSTKGRIKANMVNYGIDTTLTFYYVFNNENDTISKSVMILRVPQINLGSDTTICIGDTIVLKSNAVNSQHKWYDSRIIGDSTNTLSVSKAFKYKVVATSEFGCENTDFVSVFVEWMHPDSFMINQVVCNQNQTVLAVQDNPQYDYKWSSGESISSITVNKTGKYFVSVYPENGCKGYDSLYAYVDSVLSIKFENDTFFLNKGGMMELQYKYNYSLPPLIINDHPTNYIELKHGMNHISTNSSIGCETTDSFYVDLNQIALKPIDTSACGNTFNLKEEDICSDCQITVLEGRCGSKKLKYDKVSDGSYQIGVPENCHVYIWVARTFTENYFSLYTTDTIEFDLKLKDQANSKNYDLTRCQNSTTQLSSTKGITEIWNDGSTSDSISINTDQDPGSYWVEYVNPHGCVTRDSFYVKPLACDSAFEISGYVYQDVNENGNFEYGEKGAKNVKIEVSGALNVVTTDEKGFYSLFLYKSKIVDLKANSPFNWFFTSDSILTISSFGNVPGKINNVNFGIHSNKQTLSTEVISGILRPGFDSFFIISISNSGLNKIENIETGIRIDQLATFYSNISGKNINFNQDDSLNFTIDSLGSGMTESLRFPIKIEAGAQHLGKKICFKSKSIYLNGDDAIEGELCRVVQGSYDPNHKEISRGDGEIDSTLKRVTYIVQFQNTGTDTAFNIDVIDSINSNLFDLATIEMQYSSHAYRMRIDSNGICTWSFDNVLLVDSNTNEPLSHGTFVFDIDLKNGLTNQDTITNTVDIYFDFNSPIRTNIAKNFYPESGITSVQKLEYTFSVFPNPTNDIVIIKGQETTNFNLLLFDSNGKLVLQKKNTNSISLKNVSPGIYLLSIQDEFGQTIKSTQIVKM